MLGAMTENKGPLGFVKGGTTSLAWDRAVAIAHHDAEERRKKEAERYAAAKANPANARQHIANLAGGSQHPQVVLAIEHPSDKLHLDWIVCEVSLQGGAFVTDKRTGESGDQELVVVMACPRCIFSLHRHSEDSQLTIRSSQKKMELRHGEVPKWMGTGAGNLWVHPQDPTQSVMVAGTLNVAEWCVCPALGCGFQFQIEDSILKPYSRHQRISR